MGNQFGHPHQAYGAPHEDQNPRAIRVETLKICSQANPDLLLASRNGTLAMEPANELSPNQEWILDLWWGVEDEAGISTFAIFKNKGTRQAVSHGLAVQEKGIQMGNLFGHPHQVYEAPHGNQNPRAIRRETVKICCQANPDLLLASRNGTLVMEPANKSNPSQQWIMDLSWGVEASDEAGISTFVIFKNKATRQAVSHGLAMQEKRKVD